MPWQTLDQFRDGSVPKLNNLRRAAQAGLRVPATWWIAASTVTPALAAPPPQIGGEPIIIRSGSPTEDQRTTSNAGQLLSLVVRERADFVASLGRVVEALPRDRHGASLGAVFVQPLVVAEEAGVAFFDGFYYERAQTAGSNESLTSGQARGEVGRGHLARADSWSEWLAAIYAVFGEEAGGDRRLDIEFARDAAGFVLLQVRPALFPVKRNQTLTLANHKETMGDLPSPWTVSSMVEGGRDLSFLTELDPAVMHWEESYAVEAAERAWLNLSLWFRWLDLLGLPRALATSQLGGDQGNAADARLALGRFLRLLPRVLNQQRVALKKIWNTERALRRLDATIDRARGLTELFDATVQTWTLGIHTALAISGVYAMIARIRQGLHLPGAARVVTQDMMEEYSKVAAAPDQAQREARLDEWLRRFGHRGPLESDFARPRFVELREILRKDLAVARPALGPSAPSPRLGRRLLNQLMRPCYWIDERRERFRDQCMFRWQKLRLRLLEEGNRLVATGEVEQPNDVFWLRGQDLQTAIPLREAVANAKVRAETVGRVELPLNASRETIETLLAEAGKVEHEAAGRRVFPGISLGSAVFEGRALKADDLMALLTAAAGNSALLGPEVVLVVPTLEPSWAVVFPRVGGVVAEVGGEMSHASILLREARRPALVNCTGIFRQVRDGDRLQLDGPRGVVALL